MTPLEYLKKIVEGWGQSTIDFLPKIILAVVVLILFFALGKIVKKISLRIYSRTIRSNSDIAKVIAAVIYFFILMSGVFIALEILGLEKVLTKLLAGAGVIGIVAGFAFQDIASNAFAGLLLSLQHPFKIGDWVKMDDAYGTVIKISWLTTAIENTEGQEVFIPNQIIYNNAFSNYSSFNKRLVVIRSSITLANDLEHVKSIAIDEVNKIVDLPESRDINFFYTSIGDATFNFELNFWIRFNTEADYQQAVSDTIIRIKKRFENEKINFV